MKNSRKKCFLDYALITLLFLFITFPTALALEAPVQIIVQGTLSMSLNGAYSNDDGGLHFNFAAGETQKTAAVDITGTNLSITEDYLKIISTLGNGNWSLMVQAEDITDMNGGDAVFNLSEASMPSDVILSSPTTDLNGVSQSVELINKIPSGNGVCNPGLANVELLPVVILNENRKIMDFTKINSELDNCVSYEAHVLSPLELTPPLNGFPAGTYHTQLTFTAISL